ncbi:MAG: GNAT family N-acetyltransferase [Butyrivibrio sp.]|nr:GNAT family N-acetyltransferase [Acetatifactor muris]MCM1559375.1 GNAT family N-acetyltransferase [Butyrivibrio sp.]
MDVEKISVWKKKNYEGDTIYLKPIDIDDIQFIVDMRNQERSRYYLNQAADSTVESQTKWFMNYEPRSDDIYWIYCDKKTNRRLGTIRLYNMKANECEIGSSTADLSIKDSFFSFMEAHSLALKFANEELLMKKMHVDTRTDNKFVDVVLRRLGFEFKKIIDIRGVDYNYYELFFNQIDNA